MCASHPPCRRNAHTACRWWRAVEKGWRSERCYSWVWSISHHFPQVHKINSSRRFVRAVAQSALSAVWGQPMTLYRYGWLYLAAHQQPAAPRTHTSDAQVQLPTNTWQRTCCVAAPRAMRRLMMSQSRNCNEPTSTVPVLNLVAY
eukprot:SAG31_NODE_4166_length_3518_cov_2.348055_1_plen_145_part_00